MLLSLLLGNVYDDDDEADAADYYYYYDGDGDDDDDDDADDDAWLQWILNHKVIHHLFWSIV